MLQKDLKKNKKAKIRGLLVSISVQMHQKLQKNDIFNEKIEIIF
jgi:hypothetical protein